MLHGRDDGGRYMTEMRVNATWQRLGENYMVIWQILSGRYMAEIGMDILWLPGRDEDGRCMADMRVDPTWQS